MLAQAADRQSTELRTKFARSLAEPSADEAKLIAAIGEFRLNPLGLVLFMFPWGQEGTRLADEQGPDTWQADLLRKLGEDLKRGMAAPEAAATAIKYAVASGHGVGKTALVAWIVLWFISCFTFPQIVVTANTRTQLLTKTWRELAKWHRLAINEHWFEWTATTLKHRAYPDTWFASAIPWSEHASEAFAGTHEKYVLVIFDEASAIADRIWEVTEGALTTPNAVWLAFGNPTQNTGAFAECFGRMKHRWRTWQVDSRTAKKANLAQIQQSIDDYGEDSDFVRVRWRGVFPRAGSLQLISGELVSEAMKREAKGFEEAARVMGIDVARHGDDQSVCTRRQGLKVWPQKRWRIDDLMLLADKVMGEIADFDPDGVFIDVTGLGWGLYDALRRRLGEKSSILYAVQVGEQAIEDQKHYNRRAEVWVRMRDWLAAGGSLPDDRELEADLIGPQYGFDVKERYQLERKEDMKARGLASPDGADSLAITFATTIVPRARKVDTWRNRLRRQRQGNYSAQAA
jgi:hypothetical protein